MTAADPIDGDRIPLASAVRPNRRFLVLWLAVFAIVAAVLGLALIDWISTRRYARRQRDAMIREKVDLLRETHRLAESRRTVLRMDTRHDGSDPLQPAGHPPHPGPAGSLPVPAQALVYPNLDALPRSRHTSRSPGRSANY